MDYDLSMLIDCQAMKRAASEGNIEALLRLHSEEGTRALAFVLANAEILRKLGRLEADLLEYWPNYEGPPLHHRQIQDVIAMCDRRKLHRDNLPPEKVLTIYRGVTDPDGRGWSWTLRLDVACWRALSQSRKGGDARILKARVPASEVLWFYKGHKEQEVVCMPDRWTDMRLSAEEIKKRHDDEAARRQSASLEWE